MNNRYVFTETRTYSFSAESAEEAEKFYQEWQEFDKEPPEFRLSDLEFHKEFFTDPVTGELRP